MEKRPGQVGVAGLVGAAGGVGELAAAGGDGLADGHERLGHVDPAGVEFQPAFVDDVVGFEHQAGFHFGRVAEGGEVGEELAYKLRHAGAHTGDVDADVGDPVAFGDLADGLGLNAGASAPPSPAVALAVTMCPAVPPAPCRRQPRAITASCWATRTASKPPGPTAPPRST